MTGHKQQSYDSYVLDYSNNEPKWDEEKNCVDVGIVITCDLCFCLCKNLIFERMIWKQLSPLVRCFWCIDFVFSFRLQKQQCGEGKEINVRTHICVEVTPEPFKTMTPLVVSYKWNYVNAPASDTDNSFIFFFFCWCTYQWVEGPNRYMDACVCVCFSSWFRVRKSTLEQWH